jgi:rhodanese-related sulfurtransferase
MSRTPQGVVQVMGDAFVAQAAAQHDSVIVDIRTPDEYAQGHIAGAINIDYKNNSFSERVRSLDQSKTYFVYCRSGHRTGEAIPIMRAAGIAHIVELQGGLMQNTSVPLVTGGPISDEYVVGQEDLLGPVEATPVGPLTPDEQKSLLQMREEEKLARDVYQELGDVWGIRIFQNIAQSEQTHTSAVRSLIGSYGLQDPVIDDARGVFSNKEFSALYTDLTTRGRSSQAEALAVGALIEDLDIHDLEKALPLIAHDDIKQVYMNLERGSRNHMRAFTMQIQRTGGQYTPTYISPEMYSGIISSAHERGIH